MTEEEIRIAIAKAHGWKIIEDEHFKLLHGPHHPPEIGLLCGKHLTEDECFRAFFDSDETESIPDYLHDLNAMHEAENIIRRKDVEYAYIRELVHVSCPWCDLTNEHNQTEHVFATAAQRAEAFLRTIGKWKD